MSAKRDVCKNRYIKKRVGQGRYNGDEEDKRHGDPPHPFFNARSHHKENQQGTGNERKKGFNRYSEEKDTYSGSNAMSTPELVKERFPEPYDSGGSHGHHRDKKEYLAVPAKNNSCNQHR